MIYLLYQSPWPVGGSTSYTLHLSKVLGDECQIVRLGKRTEKNPRPLSDFGGLYTIMNIKDLLLEALLNDAPILLTASNPKHDENDWMELAKHKNVWATFHDPNEFRIYPHWKHFSPERVICIRETGLKHFKRAKFIPHPYMRHAVKRNPIHVAVSIARTSSVKNSHWIMEANRQLASRLQIELRGELNRMWWHYVKKNYPELSVHEGGYPRTWGAGVEICARAHLMVDLTSFKNDGGGTQYTLLEAIDAGAVPVMNTDWVCYPGPARTFGPAVGNTTELVALMRRWNKLPLPAQQKQNYQYLKRMHDPATICSQYKRALGA